MTQEQTIRRALKLLDAQARVTDALTSPAAVRNYLRLLLARKEHEVFVGVFLDAQNRVIASDELFRGTLTQTSVYTDAAPNKTRACTAAKAYGNHCATLETVAGGGPWLEGNRGLI